MISNAITLAALTSAAFFILYKKLPRKAKRLVVKYNLVSDVLSLLATYVIFGGTVTALIAAALVSLVMSIMLHIANHPDDYLWLTDTIKVAKQYIDEGKKQLVELNKRYVNIKDASASDNTNEPLGSN